jgi:selenocysteine-specific translation elongation factor
MVSLITSQIKQSTERFFRQSELFKIFQDTRYGMDDFFCLRSKIKLYEENKNRMNQKPIQVDWRYRLFWKMTPE